MTTKQNAKFQELVAKLREIFQIDRPELDFGIYRILNARAGEINDYLQNRLAEKVQQALSAGSAASAQQLQAELPQWRIGLVHGRLKADEKQATMAAFQAGEIDVLVATTVIEVGVDVPNASLMVIEHAERFGLSQLHQLRGRVGRGAHDSVCVLLYQTPLSPTARARL